MKENSNKVLKFLGTASTVMSIGIAMTLFQDNETFASENTKENTTINNVENNVLSNQQSTSNNDFNKDQTHINEPSRTTPQKNDNSLPTNSKQNEIKPTQAESNSNLSTSHNAEYEYAKQDAVNKETFNSKNINASKTNEESTQTNKVETTNTQNEKINKTQDVNVNTKDNNSTTTTNVAAPKIKTMKLNAYSSTDYENEKIINDQKKYNDARLKRIKGNSTYKNSNIYQEYEGILSINTDRINYKPGETVKVYTEYNKDRKKPIYSEAMLYSLRDEGRWSSMDPPYHFDSTALVSRTTTFTKKVNGNWESLMQFKLPEKMVDDAFALTVYSWSDVEDEYTISRGNSNNDIIIKVINDSSNYPILGGYDESAFDESSNSIENDSPEIIKYKTDKKIYNPNDTVKMTIEMKDENELLYMQVLLATKDPDEYKDGSGKYIPMNYANFTRSIKQLNNGNWQGTIEFTIPSYAKTSLVTLEKILASDKYGNTNSLAYDFGQKLFTIERIENTQPFSVEPVADFSKELRGKATSNMTIYAYVNNKKIGSALVIDGKYFMNIPVQKAGTKINLFTINKYNIKSNILTTVVLDKTPPKKPTISKVTSVSKVITGKGEIGSTVYIYNGNKKIGQTVVDKKGNYKINVIYQKANSKITVYSVDKSKNKSSIASLKVLDKTPPRTPSVSKITTKSTVVTGKGEAGSTVYIYNGKKKVGQATISKYGTYKIKMKAQKKGVKLTIYAIDKSKNKSKLKYSTVK